METEKQLTNTIRCKSCDFEFESHFSFCPNCGGKVIDHRLTIKSVFLEFFKNIFNVDSKLVLTFIDLILKPEIVFKSFISGARKKYYHPVSFLAIAIVLYILVANLIPFGPMDLNPDIQQTSYAIGFKGAGGSEEQLKEKLKDEKLQKKFEASKKENLEVQKKINDFIKNNGSLIAYINIPFYALIAFLVFWTKKKFNFAEMVTVVMYQNAFTTFIAFFIIPIFYLLDLHAYVLIIVTMIIIYLYSNYSFQRLFKLNALQLIFANLRFILVTLLIAILSFIIIVLIMFIIMALDKNLLGL